MITLCVSSALPVAGSPANGGVCGIRSPIRQAILSMTVQATLRTVLKLNFLVTLILAVLVLSGVSAWWVILPDSIPELNDTVEGAERWIRSLGNWGVAGSIALMIAHSFLPFPAEVIAIANGMLFGPIWGSVVTWVGAMLGATITFGLVRLIGQPFLVHILSPGRLRSLEAWSRKNGAMTLLVARLIPVIAFNLINYAAAMSGVSWWTYLWATGLGILPLTILLAVLGDRALMLPLWIWMTMGAAILICWAAWAYWSSRNREPPIDSELDDRSN